MPKYIVKRILIAVPTFLGITLLVYCISNLMPGGPMELLLSNPYMTAEDVERQKIALGLDQPVLVQYIKWLGQLFQGELGYSYRTSQSVTAMIAERIGPTLLLAISATCLSILVAIPLGIKAASKPYSVWDYASSGLSFFMAATPNFFVGLIFIFIFAAKLHLLPMGGMYDSSGDRSIGNLIQHLILPMIVLSFQQIGSWIRYTRSSMLEVLKDDYIRTAKAKGLRQKSVIFKHGFRNAMIPVVTVIGMSIPTLVGGAVITEQVFGWPGIGTLMVMSISSRDYPVIMGITVLVAVTVLIGNLITDLVYALLDPRISFR